jgi:hypothetical protein
MLGSYIIHGMYPRYELLAFAYESGLKLRDSGGITDIWEWPNIKHLYAKNNTLIIVDKNNIVAHCGLAKKYGEGISKTLKRIYELWEQHLFSKSEITLFEYPKYELPKETTLLSLILRTPPVLKFIYLLLLFPLFHLLCYFYCYFFF